MGNPKDAFIHRLPNFVATAVVGLMLYVANC
jgi:hypothetical protein